jgi:hypothetical protein
LRLYSRIGFALGFVGVNVAHFLTRNCEIVLGREGVAHSRVLAAAAEAASDKIALCWQERKTNSSSCPRDAKASGDFRSAFIPQVAAAAAADDKLWETSVAQTNAFTAPL